MVVLVGAVVDTPEVEVQGLAGALHWWRRIPFCWTRIQWSSRVRLWPRHAFH